MQNNFEKLADRLHQIPNGFPRTESGIELKLLAKLFTEEEAGLAAIMNTEAEPVKLIAQKAGWEERTTFVSLKNMVKKGLVEMDKTHENLVFKIIPFIVGFYERQNARIDKAFAEIFEQYYREAFHSMMQFEPSVHRIIPVEKSVPVEVGILPYENAGHYIDNAKSWGVLNCICRVQKKLIGDVCEFSYDNCMALSSRPNAFERNDAIKAITREEALQLLGKTEKEGLVHSVSNTKEDVSYICNCCVCCCGLLRSMADYGYENSVAKSDFIAVVDEENCSGCEICESRCQFKAISMVDGICQIKLKQCFGCGICVSTCPEEAIKLIRRDEPERIIPPENDKDWGERRMKSRKLFNE
ncbi:MAG: 4Fe-4S binding protein [Bacteroidota bacterium]